jgi:hypothetical protein
MIKCSLAQGEVAAATDYLKWQVRGKKTAKRSA